MCELVGKANLLSSIFDSKQTMEHVDLPSTCHAVSFITREVRQDSISTWIWIGGSGQMGICFFFSRGQLMSGLSSRCGFSKGSSFRYLPCLLETG